MATPKDIGPYVFSPPKGSTVLETTTILSSVLRPAGYSRDVISDIAINTFLENERTNIKAPATMHLLGLKKALLYAIPVIAIPSSNTGISLTSQVMTKAIQYDSKRNKVKQAALMVGDKYRLLGFAFTSKLVNHLAHNIFPWKYFHMLPLDYSPSPIDLSHLSEIDTKRTALGAIYLIKTKFYEEASLFNEINKIIAYKLNDMMSSVFALRERVKSQKYEQIARIDPFNKLAFISKLNETLMQQIDPTYTMSFYEALKLTANSLLYDQIELLGFSSNEVAKHMKQLAYIKDQRLHVLSNNRDRTYQALLNTRAEKLSRERYPYYFDYTDRRALFVRFNRFAIDKLPKKDQAEIKLLLEKDLASQYAMLHNKCEHIQHMKAFRLSTENSEGQYKQIASYINYDSLDADKMYSCKICTYPLMCVHEVELYDAIQIVDSKVDARDSDQEYYVRQKIINQYKVINQKRTGDEDTEASFTYYCRYCGGELGKTDDIIQTSIKTSEASSIVSDENPNEATIFMTILSVITQNLNQAIMPMSKQALTKLIFSECKSEILGFVNRANKNERDNIDALIRYLGTVYALTGLISINANSIKSAERILVSNKSKIDETREPTVEGGAQLKDEMLTALKIVQTNASLKRIGITDDKIKAMLIEGYKFMNRIFADESVQLKTSMPRDRLALDISSGPLLRYAEYMYRRAHNWKSSADTQQLTGIDLDLLYPKKRDAPKVDTHALYTNIYKPKSKSTEDSAKYIEEAYQTLAAFVAEEPDNGRYTSIVTPPVSEFVMKHEAATLSRLKLKRAVPIRYLPVENHREYNFSLKVYQIAYCLTEDSPVRPHRWAVAKTSSKLVYTCRYCKLDIEKAVVSKNDEIEDKLDEQMQIEAFFELYTLSCPIKDAHIFEENTCTQCSATKEQLDAQDPKYYKKYISVYDKYRKSIAIEMIEDAAAIMAYAKSADSVDKSVKETKTKPDMVKLESLSNSLAKLFNLSNIMNIGTDETGVRSLDIVESYVRLVYSYYTFAKNLTADTRSHPDATFFSFVKKDFQNVKLTTIPPYPTSTNADQLLIDLFQILYDLIDGGKSDTSKLIEFIIKKIIDQYSRRKAFNFAKLKAVNVVADDENGETVAAENDEDEEQVIDMFDGYDIGSDDMEDNMDSFKD